MAFDAAGIAGVAAFVATWAMAGVVLATGGGRSVNRHLAALLAVEGIAVLSSGAHLLLPAEHRPVDIIHFMADAALPPLYVLFLSHALDLKVLRPFRATAGHLALAALALAGPVLVLAIDARLLGPDEASGPALPWLLAYVALGFVFGLAVAIAAYRTARTAAARERGRSYLVAFGFFDLVWGGTYVVAGLIAAGALAQEAWERPVTLVYALATPVFVGLLAYGILRAQLFDIDLKIKLGIKRGTILLVFLGVFIAVAEVAQNVLSQEYGLVWGGVVAGVMLFAIKPIERAAERVSHAAVPRAEGSPEYLAYKKLEVYRAAVESALESGYSIDARERATLDRMRAKLGIRVEDAELVERETSAAFAA